LVDIWGLSANEWDSLVPAYTSISIFSEKDRSGDSGERDNVSGERDCCSGVILNKFPVWLVGEKNSAFL